MKEYEILEALGNVEEECVKKAKKEKKSYKTVWITLSSFAACFALLTIVPFFIHFFSDFYQQGGMDGAPDTESSQIPPPSSEGNTTGEKEEMSQEYNNIWIYYVDDDEILGERKWLPCSPKEIFNAWREKNHIGDEVEFISYWTKSNGKTTNHGLYITHERGNLFITTLTISKQLENYYNQVDSELLLESLRKTMLEYTSEFRQESDEHQFHLILE